MTKTNWFLLFAPLIGGSISGLISRPGDVNSLRAKNQPPDWVFGPVWTVLYLLMGYAASLIGFEKIPVIFWIQLALNLIWSPVFFKYKNPELAFKVIVALWVSIVLTIVEFSRLNPFAAKLLWPYLAWVTYASYLNYSILIERAV